MSPLYHGGNRQKHWAGWELWAVYVEVIWKALPRRHRWNYWNVLTLTHNSDAANVKLKSWFFFFCIQGSIEKEWVHLTVFACPRSMSSDHWKHSMPPSVKGVYKSSISNSVERRENTEAVRWLPRDKITVSCVVWCLQISSNSPKPEDIQFAEKYRTLKRS